MWSYLYSPPAPKKLERKRTTRAKVGLNRQKAAVSRKARRFSMDIGFIDTSAKSAVEFPAQVGMDEAAIIAKVIAGEREEFRHLVEAHQGLVFSMMLRYVGNEEIARELTQETFLKAFVHLQSFRGDSAFSTWLVQIGLNRAKSLVSTRRYKERQRHVEFEAERHGGETNDTSKIVERKREVEKLRHAISQLEPKYKEVVILCALEGLPYEEAAVILKIPVGTVRSRLNKARQTLKIATRGDEQ